MKNKGFTLSEILIALGVVGVVAVLTVPSMMKNYKNKIFTSQLQKVYSQVVSAVDSAIREDGVDNFYETKVGKDKTMHQFLNNYFKANKLDCAGTTSTSCLKTDAYKSLDGSKVLENNISNLYCIRLASGASVCGFNVTSSDVNCSSVVVDVNGNDGPNLAGRDLFAFEIHNDGHLSDINSGCHGGYGSSPSVCGTSSFENLHNASSGCLNAIIEAGWKMEY